jgi:hypothetical protein
MSHRLSMGRRQFIPVQRSGSGSAFIQDIDTDFAIGDTMEAIVGTVRIMGGVIVATIVIDSMKQNG